MPTGLGQSLVLTIFGFLFKSAKAITRCYAMFKVKEMVQTLFTQKNKLYDWL